MDSNDRDFEEKVKAQDWDSMNLNQIQDVLQRVNFTAGKQAEDTLKAIMESVLKKGVMPKTALQLGDDTMEAIYTQGYNMYNQGKYKDASYIFRLLMLLDYTTPKYMLGLAACMHRLKDYPNAANLYTLCSLMDPKNPLPHFHAADCYIQMGTPLVAIFSLGMAVKAAGDQPQYAVIKERAQLMRDALDAEYEASAEARFGAGQESNPSAGDTSKESSKKEE